MSLSGASVLPRALAIILGIIFNPSFPLYAMSDPSTNCTCCIFKYVLMRLREISCPNDVSAMKPEFESPVSCSKYILCFLFHGKDGCGKFISCTQADTLSRCPWDVRLRVRLESDNGGLDVLGWTIWFYPTNMEMFHILRVEEGWTLAPTSGRLVWPEGETSGRPECLMTVSVTWPGQKHRDSEPCIAAGEEARKSGIAGVRWL